MPNITLTAPADLIAAAPGLLGFAPTDSIVAYMLRTDPTRGLRVRCAIRFDVTITTEQALRFPDICNLRAADNAAAILIAVCDQRHDQHAHHILDALRDSLSSSGIQVLRRLYARDVTEPGQWLDADTGDYGDTYPYTDSMLTAHLVHEGTRVHRSRSDLEAEFSHLPPAPPVHVADHADLVTATTEEIAHAIAGAPVSSPTLATRAGIVITAHPALRDAMIGLAVEDPQAGADLWTHIARRLRAQPRAEALTVAAACLCIAADTVRAGIALDAAFDEAEATHTPTPKLADLLSSALRSAIPPTEIRDSLIASTARLTGDGEPPHTD